VLRTYRVENIPFKEHTVLRTKCFAVCSAKYEGDSISKLQIVI